MWEDADGGAEGLSSCAPPCRTEAAGSGVPSGISGAFSGASGIRSGAVAGSSSCRVAVTVEWQTGHFTLFPMQEGLTAKELLHTLQRQGTAACSSVSSLTFSSCRAVTGAAQMGHCTWLPRKDVFTAKGFPHDGHVQATVSWEGEGMEEKGVTGG